jgi:hypothetical protein
VLEKSGTKVWKRLESGDEASFAVKATIEIDVPAKDVAEILLTRDYSVIRSFNPTVEGGTDLVWEANSRITHVLTKPIFFLRPRDFVCKVAWERQSGGAELIVNSPADHEGAPVTQQYCRGTLRGLHLMEPLAGGRSCLYTCIHEIDPAGLAPRKLVNLFALRKPLTYMVQLRDLAVRMGSDAGGAAVTARAQSSS